MSLSPEEKAQFVPIIDAILIAGDLTTISEKKIRKGLQEAVKHDLTDRKDVVKALIMERFDRQIQLQEMPQANGTAHSSEEPSNMSTPQPKPTSAPTSKRPKPEDDDEAETSATLDEPKPKKKRIKDADSDAAYAAKLQAMENARGRATRGGGPKTSKPVKKKTPRKKSAGRVKAEDDSDLEGSGSEVKEKKVNRNSGFHKEMLLSPALSALFDNETKMSRPQTVKRIWAYVRERDLQEPTDKRWIICDDALRAVFKSDRIHMFTMNKILSQNLYAPDE